MHEMGIAIEIYRASREAVSGHGPGRVERVRLAVGELAAVEPDLLSFAWEAVVAGGPDAQSRLEVEWRPARQLCSACGEVAERASGSWLRLCPQCELPLVVEGGDELDILEIVYEAEEAR